METKALVKSTNINVACRFFARTPSRILRMVNICDIFLRKPFWFFLSMLSILGSIWRCFFAAIRKKYSFYLKVFLLSHVQVFLWEMSLVCLLKYPYSCFSSHFCFLVIAVLLIFVLFVLFLVAVIHLSLLFFM